MKRAKKAAEESKPIVPAYIITFSDMVTLLLTFFVLLITLASKQDHALRRNAESSIRRALANFRPFGLHDQQAQRPGVRVPKN